ncbi:MAG: Phage tail sheath protein [Methanosaeta sp. PtaU1.Bin060]|nr:MAG: Phage tail sheath protein [Methanosaeta sp. PtaU1.Bin060]
MTDGTIIEQFGDMGYPVGLTIRLGVIGSVAVPVGTNIMGALGTASRGPAMQVLALTSSYETSMYYGSGPLKRAGDVAFNQGLPAGLFVRVLGEGHAAAGVRAHDGIAVVSAEAFFGDGTVGPYQLDYRYYLEDASNSVIMNEGGDDEVEFDIIYTGTPASGEVLLDTLAGTLTFHTGEGPTSTDEITTSLKHYGNVGQFDSPSHGIIGNSAFVVVDYGTFYAHDVEEFPGDGTVGPYALKFSDYVNPLVDTTSEENYVEVSGNTREVVYSGGDLSSGKVLLDVDAGTLTFFAGQEPQTTDTIAVNLMYKTRKITVHDGDTAYPAIDNLVDNVAIQAALIYNQIVNYTPDAIQTHMPAPGTYHLAGGLDGANITTQDYADAFDALLDYMYATETPITSVVFCDYEIAPGTYDLIPILDGKLREAETNFYPMLGFIGMAPNETPAHAIAVASNFANRNLSIIPNPWDTTQPDRLDAAVARAACEATAPLGVSCAERDEAQAIKGMASTGMLNMYRKETVKALYNGRLDPIVKKAGLYPFYGRTTAVNEQYAECVDNRTVNYMITVLRYLTDRTYFKKNTPGVRASFKESLAAVLRRLVNEEVMDAFSLDVKGGAQQTGDRSLVKVTLLAQNVGHIKQFVVDYYNGVISSSA